MLYREIMAVCSEIHTKHINTVCGQNVELLNVKLAVHIATTRFLKQSTSAPFPYTTLFRSYHQFNIQQFYVLPPQSIYVFCVDLRTNSHYFPIQH